MPKLAGGVAVIRARAPSESDMKSKKEAIDYAISAKKAAAAIAVASGWLLSGFWIIAGCLAGWVILALAAWRFSRSGSGARL